MSMDQALRFMLYVEKKEELRQEFEAAVRECKKAGMRAEEMENVIREKIQPLAAKAGFEIEPAEMVWLLTEREAPPLADDKLEQAVGGSGEFYIGKRKYSCEFAPDDRYLRNMFENYHNTCPYWEFNGTNFIYRFCFNCTHLESECYN